MKIINHLAVAAFASCFALGAYADNESTDAAKASAKANYKAAMEHADAAYKADKAGCKGMSGNDKDVCMKQAKANYTKAKADAKAHKTEVKAEADKTEDKMEAVAEHCGYQSANSFWFAFKQATKLSPKEFREQFKR